MDQEELPTLNHGIDAPETFLPAPPTWVPWAIAAGIILTLILIGFIIWIFRKPKAALPPPLRDFYAIASQRLDDLEGDCESSPLAEIAAQSSLAIRSYLAGSMSEPALYETVEEFKARQPNLPSEAEEILNDLNDAKYSKSTIDLERARSFVTRSQRCLRSIHASQNVTT